jgi:ketosteroid isomerase-like protein
MSLPETHSEHSCRDAPPTRVTAFAFLQAYWRGNLAEALANATVDAVIDLPRSIPLPTPAPLAQVLPIIFERVYSCFVEGRFEIDLERCLVDGPVVVVEYTASGDLVSGRVFRCRYLVVLEMQEGRVARFRSYTDTKYVDTKLFAPQAAAKR